MITITMASCQKIDNAVNSLLRHLNGPSRRFTGQLLQPCDNAFKPA
ncbi:hypothetical protein ADG881_1827 [Alcanivorax sp. DG881]|nr:hypothetical protein ADG881_1827 [Alcanivorax sp. DG881]